MIEIAATVGFDDHHVFDANPTDRVTVQSRLHRDRKALRVRSLRIEGFNLDSSRVRYLDAKREGAGRTKVSTHIPIKTFTLVADTGERLTISYRLRKDREGWRIYDVIVQGFSVIGTYRRTFRRVISRKGIAGLFEVLVAELDDLKNESMGLSAASESS